MVSAPEGPLERQRGTGLWAEGGAQAEAMRLDQAWLGPWVDVRAESWGLGDAGPRPGQLAWSLVIEATAVG